MDPAPITFTFRPMKSLLLIGDPARMHLNCLWSKRTILIVMTSKHYPDVMQRNDYRDGSNDRGKRSGGPDPGGLAFGPLLAPVTSARMRQGL